MANFLSGLEILLQPLPMILLLLGTIIGIIFGAIPGLTATTGVALLLPITYTTGPAAGMALLVGIYIGGVSGGFISATLLGIPGTPSSVATCYDAYPMTKKGLAVKALGTGIVASFIGNVGSILISSTISPIIADFALRFGPYEYFSLGVTALTMISVLARGNMFKGLAAAFIGLLIGTIGMSPITGGARFTFGTTALTGGVSTLSFVLGTYAIFQIVKNFASGQPMIEVDLSVSGIGVTIKELTSNIWNIIRSFAVGLWIGFLPGMGSGLANHVAYAQAKQYSKHPEEFGEGCLDGIYASEVSNNAAIGGALIPMLALGIPGDTVTAMLLGGFIIQGIQPGPMLFQQHSSLVYLIFAAALIASFLVLFIQFSTMRYFSLLLKIPYKYLYSGLMVFAFVGAFASNNRAFDIGAMLVFAVIAILMNMAGIVTTPMILGFILGPMVETNLRRGLTYSDGSFLPFLTRPISGVFMMIAILSILNPIIKGMIKRRTAAKQH